ncbi:MAG: urease accessory protein UreE [Candidatus Velthaea sp.]
MNLTQLAEPLGNLADFPVGGRTIERISVGSDDLAKRVLRLRTSAGDIGLRFAGERRLRDGDIVFADARLIVATAVAPDDVLVIRPATMASAIDLAHAIGNRHIPIQREGDAIVVRYDALLEALALQHGVCVERETRVVPQPFLHAHAPHQHD